MGNLERKAAKNRTRRNLQRLVLRTVTAVGVVSAAVIAPQALAALVKLGFVPHARQKEFIHAARDRLVQKGLIEYRGGYLRTTPAGQAHLRRHEARESLTQRPKRWDGKWRVLIR